MNEIVPESPDKESEGEDENSYVPETPQKVGSPLIKSHSVIPIPSLNRIRKSLGVLDNNVRALEDNSNILSPKCRKGTENRASSASKKSAKLKSYKKDKYSNLQKVKVSLFHSRFKEDEPKKPSFSVNAKSFYGSTSKKVPESYALAPVMVKPVSKSSKKRSPAAAAKPVFVTAKKKSPTQPAAMKRHKRKGEINCGVGHGIKRPKRKRSSLNNDSMDSDRSVSSIQNNSATEEKIPIEADVNQIENFDSNNIIKSPTVEKYDPSKKFFKHRRSIKSCTKTHSLAESKSSNVSVCKPVNKKLSIDAATSESVNINDHLGLSEQDGELLIQPLVSQKDIDDWNKLTETVDFDISETSIKNVEPIDPVEDLLKILENDWVDTTMTQTVNMSTVNDFLTKDLNNIQDVISSNENIPINHELSNTMVQPINISTSSVKYTIQDASSGNETRIINLGLDDTVNKPVDNSSTSAIVESHENIKEVNEIVAPMTTIVTESFSNQLLYTENKTTKNLHNTSETVSQKDVNDLLSILQDEWIQDAESEKNPIFLENNTLSVIKPNQTIYSNTIIDDSIIEANMNNISESQNIKEDITQTNEKYYPLFYKGSSTGIEIDTTKKSKNHNKNSVSVKHCSDPKQYQIDAGQKLFGIVQCKECQLPYHLGDEDDEKAHIKYHKNWQKDSVFKFQGWKNEHIVFNDTNTNSRIILIEPSDNMSHKKKVLDILQVISQNLGLAGEDFSDYLNDKIYLYIRDKTIIGLLISTRVHTAFRMIPDLPELNCCSTESSPVKCGINVVWTAEHHRRQGIATKLVDILRSNYFYGHYMSIDDIAFSMPTPSGKIFAEKYTKTSSFKVY